MSKCVSSVRESYKAIKRTKYCDYIYIYLMCRLFIYIMEYYSVMIKTKSLLVTTWMDLEYTMLSKIGQTGKEKCYMLSLLCGL